MKSLLIAFALLFAPVAALATCPSYPYTLTNGQTADANQVMANFNSVAACAGSAVQAGANFNITSLNGLTTPLSVPQGGTGSATGAGAISNLGGLQASLNLTDVANEMTALHNLGGVAFANNGSDFANLATTFNNLAPSQTSNSGKFLTTNGTTTSWAPGFSVSYAEFRNQQTSGTGSGETLTASTWKQRVLNTTASNTIAGASLTSNQITLPAGTYRFSAVAPSVNTSTLSETVGSRLRNITASSTIAVSQAIINQNSASTSSTNLNTLSGVFVLAGSTVIEIDTYMVTSGGTASGGVALGSGEPEIYSDVLIEKIG